MSTPLPKGESNGAAAVASQSTEAASITSGPGLGAQAPSELEALRTELAAMKARKQPDVAALVEERLAAALAPIMERLGPAPEAPRISDPVAAQAVDESRKELAKLRKQIAEDKRQAHETSLRGQVASKLSQHVRPEAVDVALGYFLDARKAAQVVDERGTVKATWDGADYDSLDEAIGAFLGSKQAALFLPPPKAAAPVAAKPAAPSFNGAQRPTSISKSVAERMAELRAMGYDVGF